MLKKIAKAVRVLTVPPVMVAVLMTLLWFFADVFLSAADFFWILLFLGAVPLFAYPFQKMIPTLRAGGRKMQRRLAFLWAIGGYIGALVFALLRRAGKNALFLVVVYCLSLLFLTAINLTPLHASGHASSLVGPLTLLVLFIGPVVLPFGIFLFFLTLWASLYLGRHTIREFLLGALLSLAAIGISYLLLRPAV